MLRRDPFTRDNERQLVENVVLYAIYCSSTIGVGIAAPWTCKDANLRCHTFSESTRDTLVLFSILAGLT
jgi:hypothetical protein